MSNEGIGVADLFKDAKLRYWFLWSLLAGSVLVTPRIMIGNLDWEFLKASHILQIVSEYLSELGFAIFVSLPILLTVELFNQRRHADQSENRLRQQAFAMVYGDLPATIKNYIQSGIIEASFYKSDYTIRFNLSIPDTSKPQQIKLSAQHSFNLRRMRSRPNTYKYAASLTIGDASVISARFLRLRVGGNELNEKQIDDYCKNTETGVRELCDYPEIPVPAGRDDYVDIFLETENIYDYASPFEAVVTVLPAVGMTIQANAPANLVLSVESLHGEEMIPSTKPPTGYRYEWVQPHGLISGQGAMLRWRPV